MVWFFSGFGLCVGDGIYARALVVCMWICWVWVCLFYVLYCFVGVCACEFGFCFMDGLMIALVRYVLVTLGCW